MPTGIALTEPVGQLITCTACNYQNGIYRTECFRCHKTLPHIKTTDTQYSNQPLVTDTTYVPTTVPTSIQSQPASPTQHTANAFRQPTHTSISTQYNRPLIYNENIHANEVLQSPVNNPIRTPTHNRIYTAAAGRPSSAIIYADRGKRKIFNFDNIASQQIDHLKYYDNGLGHGEPAELTYEHQYNQPQYPYQRNEQLETHVDEHKYEHKYNGNPPHTSTHTQIPPSTQPAGQPRTTPSRNARFDDATPVIIDQNTATQATQTPANVQAQTQPQQQTAAQQPMYHQSLQSTPVGARPAPANSVDYVPTPYDVEPYGRDLAEKVTTFLLARGGIYYKRYSGWSTGLFYNRLYGFLYYVLFNGEIHYELPDRIIYQTFNELEFKHWLAEQSDWSLSGHELGPEFFMKGRVNKKLMLSAIDEMNFFPIH